MHRDFIKVLQNSPVTVQRISEKRKIKQNKKCLNNFIKNYGSNEKTPHSFLEQMRLKKQEVC